MSHSSPGLSLFSVVCRTLPGSAHARPQAAAAATAASGGVRQVSGSATHISRCLAHSGQRMSEPSVMKPLPTRELPHVAQMKQSLCQCRSSNEINRVPPMPDGRGQMGRGQTRYTAALGHSGRRDHQPPTLQPHRVQAPPHQAHPSAPDRVLRTFPGIVPGSVPPPP